MTKEVSVKSVLLSANWIYNIFIKADQLIVGDMYMKTIKSKEDQSE